MADSGGAGERREEEEDDVVCLDASFFVDRSYEITTFSFGSQVLHLLCLRAASTDYDLTGQLVWPGAVLMNTYLSEHPETVKDHSVIELGSGVGITGILCSRFCKEVVLTDHNDEVLEIIKKNIEMQSCSGNDNSVLTAEKLEWGNHAHISNIIEKHPAGFDLVLGADICFQQSSISCLFDTVERLLRIQAGKCRFILAYVSRAKVMDVLVLKEAEKHGMHVKEVDGTRTTVSNLEGVIYDIALQ
ncbi:protein N-terminal and lysine N-methyltransferase efm7 [Oryza brachyantha]|uniref:Protein N-lysine methyltransferase METTL21A n=1 Tax=Oryza brachyantha TaxID=4533 RepID=J3MNG8_ORYBR|nr:protein N-terminal and lysine N-methyltransferase efm7 [Oryza brachyantha]